MLLLLGNAAQASILLALVTRFPIRGGAGVPIPSTRWPPRPFGGSAAALHGPPSMSRSSSRFIGKASIWSMAKKQFHQTVCPETATGNKSCASSSFQISNVFSINQPYCRLGNVHIAAPGHTSQRDQSFKSEMSLAKWISLTRFYQSLSP